MQFIPQKTTLFAASLALLAVSLFSTGCSDAAPEQAEVTKIINATYETRGEITALPDADNPTSSLMIRHEAIPDFVDESGKTVGMDTMVMPFPIAESINLGEFAVGDKVAVTFDVFTESGIRGYAASEMATLPADTELDFSKLERTAGDHAGHDHHGHDHAGHNH